MVRILLEAGYKYDFIEAEYDDGEPLLMTPDGLNTHYCIGQYAEKVTGYSSSELWETFQMKSLHWDADTTARALRYIVENDTLGGFEE